MQIKVHLMKNKHPSTDKVSGQPNELDAQKDLLLHSDKSVEDKSSESTIAMNSFGVVTSSVNSGIQVLGKLASGDIAGAINGGLSGTSNILGSVSDLVGDKSPETKKALKIVGSALGMAGTINSVFNDVAKNTKLGKEKASTSAKSQGKKKVRIYCWTRWE